MKRDEPTVITRFQSKLVECWPPETWTRDTVVVACSGGPDSMALLRGLTNVAKHGRIVVGHYNHCLRGEGSDADEAFVRQTCKLLDLPCETGRGGVVVSRGDGIEEAARAARYDFLRAIAERTGARYVATGHTADDQAETILHHIVRGTGLVGLTGMPKARPLSDAIVLLRPLLDFRRSEIVEYLAAIGQGTRHDSTNEDLHFTRNRIRKLMSNLARDFNPDIVAALLRMGQVTAGAQAVIDQIAVDLLVQAISRNGSQITVDCAILTDQPRHLVREMFAALWRAESWSLQSMGFDEWERLATMALETASTRETLPGNVDAKKKDGQLVLTHP